MTKVLVSNIAKNKWKSIDDTAYKKYRPYLHQYSKNIDDTIGSNTNIAILTTLCKTPHKVALYRKKNIMARTSPSRCWQVLQHKFDQSGWWRYLCRVSVTLLTDNPNISSTNPFLTLASILCVLRCDDTRGSCWSISYLSNSKNIQLWIDWT